MVEEGAPAIEAWHSQENSELVTVKGWKSADEAVNSYRELEQSMGTRIKMPDDKTTPEEKSAFYQKLGRPETAADYTRPTLPDGTTLDEDFYSYMTAAAMECGASDVHLGFLMQKYIAYQTKLEGVKEAAKEAQADADDKTSHEEWGGDYDKNSEIARRAFAELAPEEIREPLSVLIKDKGLEFNPVFKKFLFSIGSKIMDDTLVKGDPAKPEPGYKPANPASPEMYANGESEECVKARAYFTAHGHIY